MSDYNSFVEIGSFDVEVIEDFEGPGTEGFEFSEGVVRSIQSSGLFSQILQEEPHGEVLRIRGRIIRYSRGNPAMRLRYGHNIDKAHIDLAIWNFGIQEQTYFGTENRKSSRAA